MFWDLKYTDTPALIQLEDYQVLTYAQLNKNVQIFVDELSSYYPQKSFGIIYMRNSISSIVAYLAALQKNDAVLLLDAKLSEALKQQFIDTYSPDWIFEDRLHIFDNKDSISYYEDLAILLSTSGSTGNPKLVRLSRSNLQSNAESISKYLNISNSERPITTLSPAYSYGLSVINSHLLQGATVLLTDESMLGSKFWTFFKQYEATSFAGVPYIYQMLHRLRFQNMQLPSLRYFTQAGGRLSIPLIDYFHQTAEQWEIPFFVMYGQTEASARISYVPPDQLANKKGSIGIAIPNGKLEIDANTGELVYEGPNVMLGYAETKADFMLGNVQQGKLHTGDFASIDEDGYFWIKGRLKRFIKLYGLRMNLDDLERFLEPLIQYPIACTGIDEKLLIIVEGILSVDNIQYIRQQLKTQYGIHHTSLDIRSIDHLPRLNNGKVNYSHLLDEVKE
ncbi:AMP-binding protein [Paenibacillus hunanensis]|uniref:AMP-binding protein n=1 Tax=Paenibacillus hunanensis TaxID=539262 RepID=UPI0020270C09|nr:AMP-binding protein [Paenibacillus hunanensis]MCL9662773.1 AMP-binding protein [Paenibacillus hunanensis]